MRTKIILTAIIVTVVAGSFLAKGLLDKPGLTGARSKGEYERIVSLSPSITEILFALGAGDRVVGVTAYCEYPSQARTRAKVGGFLDPNFEAIVALEPDLVVLRGEPGQPLPAFEELELPTLVVSHKHVQEILDSITTIGSYCGADSEAARLVGEIEAQIERVRQKTAGLDRPRVMFAVERTLGTGRIEDIYIAGQDGFIDKVIALAGGQNACPDTAVRFPVVSHEGIMQIDPQVIIDLVAKRSQRDLDPKTILDDWQQLADVEAVRNGRVYLVDDDFAFIPGHRFPLMIERLARLMHPEVNWEQ